MIPRYRKWVLKKSSTGWWMVVPPLGVVFKTPVFFPTWGGAVAYLSRTLSHYQYEGGTWWHI